VKFQFTKDHTKIWPRCALLASWPRRCSSSLPLQQQFQVHHLLTNSQPARMTSTHCGTTASSTSRSRGPSRSRLPPAAERCRTQMRMSPVSATTCRLWWVARLGDLGPVGTDANMFARTQLKLRQDPACQCLLVVLPHGNNHGQIIISDQSDK